jgi:hypothetical protein
MYMLQNLKWEAYTLLAVAETLLVVVGLDSNVAMHAH